MSELCGEPESRVTPPRRLFAGGCGWWRRAIHPSPSPPGADDGRSSCFHEGGETEINESAVVAGIAWYRRDQWARLRDLASDAGRARRAASTPPRPRAG